MENVHVLAPFQSEFIWFSIHPALSCLYADQVPRDPEYVLSHCTELPFLAAGPMIMLIILPEGAPCVHNYLKAPQAINNC